MGFYVRKPVHCEQPGSRRLGIRFFSISSMNGLFMPIMSAVVVSRICDMEHKGSTWKMLAATNVGRGRLYATKYICTNSLILYGIGVQALFIIVFGLTKDFPVRCLAIYYSGSLEALSSRRSLLQLFNSGYLLLSKIRLLRCV